MSMAAPEKPVPAIKTPPAVDGSGDGSAPRKLLRLLEVLGSAPRPLRLAEIATDAAIAKPTAHRLLAVLVDQDWAVTHEGGVYEIGPRARAVAATAGRGPANANVDDVLGELSRDISQTVHLGLRAGDHFVYTHKVDGPQAFGIASHLGMQQLLHCTAIGKCILADMNEQEVRDLVSRTGLPSRTPNTHTIPASLLDDLGQIRKRGYALDEEENEANIRCLAVPVRVNGRTVGAISASAVTFVCDKEQTIGFASAVKEAALKVQEILR